MMPKRVGGRVISTVVSNVAGGAAVVQKFGLQAWTHDYIAAMSAPHHRIAHVSLPPRPDLFSRRRSMKLNNQRTMA
ncbi:hypothetical protein RA280_16435 [Cupriavidus sp. CV2]|uniref:hypothetical protein n=1 Tax=Cupriavidus ulmosensis TaxID=3065913 RepID=UPI00296B0B7F|nr:hypothetical protein [Cupriavidus sp. CV2]MDW3683310.1 hypothetical protein [Cupriavidus sp. CV2]